MFIFVGRKGNQMSRKVPKLAFGYRIVKFFNSKQLGLKIFSSVAAQVCF